jgi:hypothetical protein
MEDRSQRPQRRRATIGVSLAGVLLAAILLLGFGLRLAALTQESLWYDEFGTYATATLPSVGQVVAAIHEQAIQPLYFVLLHWFLRVVGANDWTLRLPSALAGSLAPLLAWWLARSLFPGRRRLALASAFAMAVSPMSIWYSQEARPYALEVTLELAALALLADACRRAGQLAGQRRWAGAGLAAAAIVASLAVETHNFAIFPWAACLGTVLCLGWTGRLGRRDWLVASLLLAAGVVHAAFSIADRLGTRAYLSFLPDRYGPELWGAALNAQLIGPLWSPLPSWAMTGAMLSGAALVAWGLVVLARGLRRDPLPGLLLGLGFATAFLAPILISFVKPIVFYGQRYMIVALPFMTQLLALGVAGDGERRTSDARGDFRRAQGAKAIAPGWAPGWAWRRGWSGLFLRGALFAVALGAQGTYLWQYYAHRQKQPWDLAAKRIVQMCRRDELVVVMPMRTAGVLEHYLPAGWPVAGVWGVDNLGDLQRLFKAERKPVTLVSYDDLRPLLAQAGAPKPKRVDVMETYQPGQELWIIYVPAPGASAPGANGSGISPRPRWLEK